MSGILKVGGSELINDNGGSGALQWGSGVPAGTVLKVVSVEKTDTQSTDVISPNFADVTGLSATITPKSASNKILVTVSIGLGFSTSSFAYARILRDSSTLVGEATNSGSDPRGNRPSVNFHTYDQNNAGILPRQTSTHLDSPSTTNSVTYKVQFASTGNVTVYVNRSERDSNSSTNDTRMTSTITLMEIAG